MNLYVKIILILFGLAYLISPVDIIPELFVPYIGWIDDGFVLWTILHLIRYGEMPWFLFKKKNRETTHNYRSNSGHAPSQNAGKTKNKADFSGNESKGFRSSYEILGVSADATWEQIQAAYKEKIKQYHPDKVSHLGEEFSHLANEKFLEIQKAYGDLKSKF